MNKINLLLICILILNFIVSCSKDSDEIDSNPQNVIDGVLFTPTKVLVKKYKDKYEFTFSENDKTIFIAVNDTIEGTYYFGSTESNKLAELSYLYQEYEYVAKSGSVKLVKTIDCMIQGIYSGTAVHQISGNSVEIENVLFNVKNPTKIEDMAVCESIIICGKEVSECCIDTECWYEYNGKKYSSQEDLISAVCY